MEVPKRKFTLPVQWLIKEILISVLCWIFLTGLGILVIFLSLTSDDKSLQERILLFGLGLCGIGIPTFETIKYLSMLLTRTEVNTNGITINGKFFLWKEIKSVKEILREGYIGVAFIRFITIKDLWLEIQTPRKKFKVHSAVSGYQELKNIIMLKTGLKISKEERRF